MTSLTPPRRIALALSYGAITHGTFALGVGSMVLCMGFGMQLGLGPFSGALAWVVNLLLLLQFPALHSFLLSTRGRAWLARLSPGQGDTAKTLSPTTYALVASLQLALLFWGWSPSGTVWWQAQGTALYVMGALYMSAWGFLGLAILNGGLGLQSGFIGWWALLRDKAPKFPDMPTRYLYALTRNPIYLAFTCTLWTVPTWSPDQLVVAIIWTAYCVLAPHLKERRFAERHGERFKRYQARVPYFLPIPKGDRHAQRHPAE